MSRAERRRAEREQKKRGGIQKPDAQAPVAILNFSTMSTQEVGKRTGTETETLKAWEAWKTEDIKKKLMIEMQQKMDQFQDYSTVCNIIITMKALEGFRYGKAAAQWIQKHYSACTYAAEQTKMREIYQDLHERWGINIEFDEPDINELMGIDYVDWRREYCKMKIPAQVYALIWDDSANIERAQMQIAVLWELCEEFGFHKKGGKDGTMLEKFMRGLDQKYNDVWNNPKGITQGLEMINRKYNANVDISKGIRKTVDFFDL